MKSHTLVKCGAVALLMVSSAGWAAGMIPETSVVIVEQSDGEGSMNVANSDSSPNLLITRLENVSGDNITKMISVTPPAARVEPGKSQLVRFIMTDNTPLEKEHLGRAIFEGVPPKVKGKNVVRMNVRQNLPLLVRPANLPRDAQPWKRLVWKKQGNAYQVINDSAYVVRLGQSVQTLPDNKLWSLPASYVLPGQT